MTIIDELVVLLRLDGASSFEKGQKQTQEALDKSKKKATETSKEMELRAKKATEGYSKFRNEIIGLFAAFTAGVGLKDFISDTIKSEANLGRMSKALDISVETLSAWQGVLKRNGGTAEDATGAFRSLADILAELQTTGTTSKGGILMRLGIQASDLKDPQAAIIKMANVARTMDPVIASSLLRQVGFSESMTNAMLLGGQALQAQLEAQRKIGVTTEADTKAAQKLQNTLEGLKTASARLGAEILTVLAPAIDVLAQGISLLAEFAQRNKPILIGLFVGIGAAILALSAPLIAVGVALAAATFPVWGPIIGIGVALGVMAEITMKAIHAFAEFARTNKDVSAAIEEVKEAASALWQAIVSLVAPLRPVFTWIASAFRDIGNAIGEAFGGLAMATARTFINFLVNGLHAVADGIKAVTALLRGDLKGALAAAKDFNADMNADALSKTSGRGSHVTAPPVAAASTPVTSSAAPPTNVVQFMRSKGLTQEQALGVAAGIDAESKTNPSAVNGKSGAFGIGQWLGPRRAELFRRYGPNPSMAQQLEFLAWELMGGDRGGQSVLRSRSASEAMRAYVTKVMRPAKGGETTGDIARGDRFLAANGNLPSSGIALGSQVQAANSGGVTSTTTVQIDTIHVNAPNARDADGVAASLAPALKRRLGYVSQVGAGIG